MKAVYSDSTTWAIIAGFFAMVASSLVSAEIRPFTNDNGTVIQAELVSHQGDKVKLKRADGKEFEVNPTIFSNEDETYIKNWIAKNPVTKNYNFKLAISKKKVEGNSVNMGYKRVKNDLWSYILTVTNSSQDPVSKLTVQYRVFYSNAADGSYSSNDQNRLKMIEGLEKIEAQLPFNGILEITTTPVQIDIVNYDGVGDRYKDQLKGCLVRIIDEAGNTVFDWASPEVGMKGKTWLNTNPPSLDSKKAVIIR